MSEALRAELRGELGDACPARLEVAPMGVDLAVFSRGAPYAPWRGDGPFRIFCCGRLNKAKGQDVLVRAVAALRAEGLDAELVLAGDDDGDGAFRRELEDLARELGTEDRVRIRGGLAEAEVAAELQRSHAFALASLHEAIGVATMEAMSLGLPVVVTRVGGVPELVSDGETGFLVPPGDAAAMAAALRRIAREPDTARHLGAAAAAVVRARFHSGRSAELLLSMLREARERPRILLVVPGRKTAAQRAEMRALADRGEMTRGHVVEEITGATLIDELALESRALYRRLPTYLALALEAYRRRDAYDVVMTWAEQVSVFYMLLQRATGDRHPHVALLYWMSKTTVKWPLRVAGGTIARIVTWTSVQRRYAEERLGVPAERIFFTRHFVDQEFWHPARAPLPAERDLVASAGAEMRDFPTFAAAMRGTPLRGHIAAREYRITTGLKTRRVPAGELAGLLPPNVTLAPLGAVELRELYARAAFVVVPLVETDKDNGVNVLLESMAMGKAVICSRTTGQVDVIEEGVTGLHVPVGDPEALQRAMLALHADPARARAMGAAARRYVEETHTLEGFARDLLAAAAEAAAERR